MYLFVRNHAIRRQTHVPSIYRFYTTVNVDTTTSKPVDSLKKIDPVAADHVKENDSIGDVLIVKGSSLKSKKRSKTPLSQRLRKSALKPGWRQVPDLKGYEKIEPPNHVDVATLAHGLDRVLFNPGVHYLKDPRTKLYNYPTYLENITQPVDFDFEALQPYITSSKDNNLINMAKSLEQHYIGSTSSISAVLSHFYFLMSNFKPVSLYCLSSAFEKQSAKFTRGQRSPASIFLRWKDGVYAIDVDKSYDIEETILSRLGKSLEKVLTSEPADFERYLKENSSQITEEERNQPESYAYGKFGKFLLRSQLDCYDERLPRRTFDLKTRAVAPIRIDIRNYTDYLGYTLKHAQGLYESFEREYYDMMRSAFLKYSFQVRIGHMDGILLAYHNTQNIFGFQYISREEMDSRIFGSSRVANKVFENCLFLFESVLDEATKKYPDQTLRLSFDTHPGSPAAIQRIFVEPVPENEENSKQDADSLEEFFETSEGGEDSSVYEPFPELSLYELKTQSFINGKQLEGPLNAKKTDKWSMNMHLAEVHKENDEKKRMLFRAMRKKQANIRIPRPGNDPNMKLYRSISDRGLQKEQREQKDQLKLQQAEELWNKIQEINK